MSLSDIYYHVQSETFLPMLMSENFFHIRLNDGDFDSILQTNSTNGNGDQLLPAIGKDTLALMLQHVPSPHVLLSGGVYWYRDNARYRNLLEHIKLQNPQLKIAYTSTGDIGVELLMYHDLFEVFLNFLRQKRVVVIGPAYLSALKLFDHFDHIVIPHTNAYVHKEAIIEGIAALNVSDVPTNYCFQAGPLSKAVIHHFSTYDTRNSYYDIGSSWDFFFQSSPTYDWPRGQRRDWYERWKTAYNQFYGAYIV